MIKRTITYAVLALALGLGACTQDDAPDLQEQEISINFTTDAIQTRVNTLGTGDVWENGDQIMIDKLVDDFEYHIYTATVAGGNTTWTPDKKLYWNKERLHWLRAYYPISGQNDYDLFDLPDDQSSEAKLKSADCMNAVWKGYPTTDAITFQMKHRLSLITINYDFATEFTDARIASIVIKSINDHCIFDGNDNGKMDVSGNFDYDITPLHNETNKTIQAIVIPCTYPKGQLFMEIDINNETLQVKMPEAKTLKEGTHYTFDLKVGKNKVELTPVSTNDDFPGGWDDDSEENLK